MARPTPISPHMRASLWAIHFDGSVAHPIGGGCWKGESGRQLSFRVHIDGQVCSVTSNTIYALLVRGLLENTTPDLPRWRASYRITIAGNWQLEEWAAE